MSDFTLNLADKLPALVLPVPARSPGQAESVPFHNSVQLGVSLGAQAALQGPLHPARRVP